MSAFEAEAIKAFGTADLYRGSAAEITMRMRRAIEAASTQPLVYDLGDLWRYEQTSGTWVKLDQHAVTRLVMMLDGRPIVETSKSLKVGGGLWRDVFAGLSSGPSQRSGFFAEAAVGLAFSNGFLAVTKDGARLVQLAPEHRSRHAYPLAWDAEAGCPRWIGALDAWGLDDATQSVLCEWVGTALIGQSTAGGRWVLIHGDGGNGKSVCVKVIQGLFPAEWRSAVPVQDLGDRFSGSQLVGVRLNSVEDLESKDLLHTGKLKAVVTGGEIQAERKHRDGFAFCPEAGHLFAVNPPLPAVNDLSDGFWDRVMMIGFHRKFRGQREQIERFEDVILREELAGVVAWAVYGAVRRMRNGWTDRVDVDRENWRRNEDAVALWLEERASGYGAASQTETKAAALYEDYQAWSRRCGKGVMSMTKWGGRMKAILGSDGWGKGRGGMFYRVELQPSTPYLAAV